MPDHRRIVARGFRIGGWLLGAPSALAALALGAGAVMAGSGPPAPKSHPLDVTTYGLAGPLANAGAGVGQVLAFLNGLAAWAFALLAALALAVALFAGLLWLIGRGLAAAAAWARIAALALLAVLSLTSLLALAGLRGGAWLGDAAALAALLYALWALWKFSGDPVDQGEA